jgi:hypothetical protein
MLNSTDNSIQSIVIEPTTLVDQASTTDIYIGTSRSFKDPGAANWRIKRIWQVGTVWYEGYPSGDQDFTFIWDLRTGYDYS